MIWIEVQSSRFPREAFSFTSWHICSICSQALLLDCEGGVPDSSGENSFSNFTPTVSDRQEVSHMDLRQLSSCWVSSKSDDICQNELRKLKIRL